MKQFNPVTARVVKEASYLFKSLRYFPIALPVLGSSDRKDPVSDSTRITCFPATIGEPVRGRRCRGASTDRYEGGSPCLLES